MRLNLNKKNRGFTLIELMVSISVFTFIMVISMGSILSVIDANRKSQSLRSVMDNLNYTLEAMTRNIRFGKVYHCDVSYGLLTQPNDCSGGANSMSVYSSSGVTQTSYRLEGGRIIRKVNGGSDEYLTGTDVTITNLTFYVSGSSPYSSGSNLFQPKATIVISGYVGSKENTKSTFTIETMVSQRVFDTQ